jgi:hypothetical protein
MFTIYTKKSRKSFPNQFEYYEYVKQTLNRRKHKYFF